MTVDLPLDKLPSTFYRVTVKGLVFDDRQRLLVCVNDEGGYELPGGGLEYDETLEDCLRRELQEELGAELSKIGQIVCVYYMRSPFRNVPVVRIAVRVAVAPGVYAHGDTIVSSRYVTKEEFLALDLKKYEGPVQDYADSIWASSKASIS
jgi:8-oxo-dGTP pyrophosphatase MutT (NUDIX family)